MSRRKYIPPRMHTIRLQVMPLLQVSSVKSDDVKWNPSGFSETEEDR